MRSTCFLLSSQQKSRNETMYNLGGSRIGWSQCSNDKWTSGNLLQRSTRVFTYSTYFQRIPLAVWISRWFFWHKNSSPEFLVWMWVKSIKKITLTINQGRNTSKSYGGVGMHQNEMQRGTTIYARRVTPSLWDLAYIFKRFISWSYVVNMMVAEGATQSIREEIPLVNPLKPSCL